jgi:hypothetical protein
MFRGPARIIISCQLIIVSLVVDVVVVGAVVVVIAFFEPVAHDKYYISFLERVMSIKSGHSRQKFRAIFNLFAKKFFFAESTS